VIRRKPVRRAGDRYVISLGDDESAMVRRLLSELRALLTDPAPESDTEALLARLFPVAHPDDEDEQAEYHRLMGDELVQSKLGAIAIVDDVLAGNDGGRVDEGGMFAFMQSINSIRLVLGTMLGVTDDPDVDEVPDGVDDSPEYHLYAYLSWLLEHTVRTMSE
jgi:hypothetical protein